MKHEYNHLPKYIDSLQSRGNYILFKEEALKTLNITDDAFRSSAKRLAKDKRLCRLRKGLYVIIPLEYKNLSAPPPEWYIHSLMEHLKVKYYVGLLTAAAYHGAAHQAPQVYQVIAEKKLRSLIVGRSKLVFSKSSLINKASIQKFKVITGNINISTPEQTAFDLARYMKESGGINRTATILYELQERMNADKLVEVASKDVTLTSIQRIGYILEDLGPSKLVLPLKEWLHTKKTQYIPLKPSKNYKNSPKNEDWKILINEKIEIDL